MVELVDIIACIGIVYSQTCVFSGTAILKGVGAALLATSFKFHFGVMTCIPEWF